MCRAFSLPNLVEQCIEHPQWHLRSIAQLKNSNFKKDRRIEAYETEIEDCSIQDYKALSDSAIFFLDHFSANFTKMRLEVLTIVAYFVFDIFL